MFVAFVRIEYARAVYPESDDENTALDNDKKSESERTSDLNTEIDHVSANLLTVNVKPLGESESMAKFKSH